MSFLKYLFFLTLLFPQPILAADIIINCRQSQCASVEPWFRNNLYIAPGKTINRSVTVNNYRSDRCYLSLESKNLSPKSRLNHQLNLKITRQHTIYFQNQLTAFFSLSSLSLDTVPAKDSSTYNFALSLPLKTDNRFQNQQSAFNLNFIFTCRPPPSSNLWHRIKYFFSFLGK